MNIGKPWLDHLKNRVSEMMFGFLFRTVSGREVYPDEYREALARSLEKPSVRNDVRFLFGTVSGREVYPDEYREALARSQKNRVSEMMFGFLFGIVSGREVYPDEYREALARSQNIIKKQLSG